MQINDEKKPVRSYSVILYIIKQIIVLCKIKSVDRHYHVSISKYGCILESAFVLSNFCARFTCNCLEKNPAYASDCVKLK